MPILALLLIAGIFILPGFAYFNYVEVDFSDCGGYIESCKSQERLFHSFNSVLFMLIFWFAGIMLLAIVLIFIAFLLNNWKKAKKLASKEIKKEKGLK